MKINKGNAGFIFVIVLLVVCLGLSIYLGISGWYFYNDGNYTTDLQLGKTIQTSIKKNESAAISLNIAGSFLPGEEIPQIIAVKNIGEDNVFLRAKAFITDGNNDLSLIKLMLNDKWIYREEDGYFYYNELLTSQNKSTLCTQIVMPDKLILQTTKKYMASVVFECIDSEQNPIQLWGFNPLIENF